MFGKKQYRRLVRAAALLALSSLAIVRPAAAAPLTFVYKGAGCDGRKLIPQFETVIGRKVDGVTDFVDWTSTWSNMVLSANWIAGCWQGSGYKLNLSVPLMARQHSATPLHDLAAGNFNTYFTQIAKTLVAHGYGDAYIRLGEEFNQGYYPWAGAGSPTLWVQGYRQAQAAMKAVPGANFRFVWNPAMFMGQFYPDQAYPGDDVVDVMGTDAYNASWDANYTDPKARWNTVLNDSWALAEFTRFAKKHNKPYAFPEWGTGQRADGHGGTDDAMFVANITPFVQKAEYAAYWDYPASDYNGVLSGAPQPGALAAFIASFGSTGAGSNAPVQEEKTIGAIMQKYASTFASETAPVVTCTNCYVSVQQNGPGHWMLVVWYKTAQPSAQVSWNFKPMNGNVYDPAVGTSPTQGLGQATSATLALTAKKPLIIALQK